MSDHIPFQMTEAESARFKAGVDEHHRQVKAMHDAITQAVRGLRNGYSRRDIADALEASLPTNPDAIDQAEGGD